MKRDQIHEKVSFKDVRELVEYFGEKYKGKPSFTFRVNPKDPEPVKKLYDELRSDIQALATELIAKGYKGKHIAVIGKQSYPWVVSYFAIMSIGSVLVPLDREWAAADLADTAKKADISFAILDTDILDKGEVIKEVTGIGEVYSLGGETDSVASMMAAGYEKVAAGDRSYYEAEIDPMALGLLVFTSGTTGKGKGVMLSQNAILEDLSDVIPYINFDPKTLNVLPPHHTYGSSVTILGQASIGCEIYISSGIVHTLRELETEKPGHIVMVPLYLETFYRKVQANIKKQGKEKLVGTMIKVSNFLRKIGIDLRRVFFKEILKAFGGKLHLIITGGAAIATDIQEFFESIGITVLNGYGITECAPIIAVNHSKRVARGSVGYVLPIDEVKIDEPNEDGEGEIIVRGPNVMLGYWKDPETTAEVMTEDGFFRTGDYGKFGKDGALYITGRKKNLIILSNGKNVYPEEIEAEFIAVPGVQDIIVYEGQSKRGIQHNAIVAEIYPDQEYVKKNKIEDIKAYLQGFVDNYNKTAVSYKKIGILRVRDEDFPKNTLRKIMRFKLDMTID